MKLIGKAAGWLLALAASTIIALNFERLAVAQVLMTRAEMQGQSD